ncbi:NAD(P)/FAD-dependent oxidoreductase [Parahaliea maris]|uniref:NAD(P)/FAD-dependent oxidoreductase n=2 Tax=Parahaliea maris TaxID=2716870 RepID=A0A5C8ZRX5_9GAMM|nr:NAD(P)/FAD-dependent oxidoreductase [Parahaliea maris]
MYLVHRLREAGYSVQGFDAAGDVGGTWYWNRYPGARCDIPSLLYSYSWSDKLRHNFRWSEKYATQPEILEYAQLVADTYDLRPFFRFSTRVESARYDEANCEWVVETDAAGTWRGKYLFLATGCLSVPNEPDFPGQDSFQGDSYQTSTWPHEGVDFSGKRVAVIGTGSSAIQSIPLIAEQAESVHVFQRTPNFSLPALNGPIPEEERQAFEAMYEDYRAALAAGEPGIEMLPEDWEPSDEELAEHVKILWNGGGLVSTVQIPRLTKDERINAAAAEFVRERIQDIVDDPDTARRLTPHGYPIATKRACVDTNYYQTYNLPHVHLVSLQEEPLVEITPQGVKTEAREYPVDAIVYALGFDAMTGALTRINPVGRNGLSLQDAWAEGPTSFLGTTVAGFPNLFTITGPFSPSVIQNVILSIEQHVDWIMEVLARAREAGSATIEITREAQQQWMDHAADEANQTLFPQAGSWYMGANIAGKPRVLMPYVGREYKQKLDANISEGFPGLVFS